MIVTPDIEDILLISNINYRIKIFLYIIETCPPCLFNLHIPFPQWEFRIIMDFPVVLEFLYGYNSHIANIAKLFILKQNFKNIIKKQFF